MRPVSVCCQRTRRGRAAFARVIVVFVFIVLGRGLGCLRLVVLLMIMKKHWILVSVNLPEEDEGGNSRSRLSFVSATQNVHDTALGLRKLSESTWLLPRENALPALARIVTAADNNEASYEVRYLTEDLPDG